MNDLGDCVGAIRTALEGFAPEVQAAALRMLEEEHRWRLLGPSDEIRESDQYRDARTTVWRSAEWMAVGLAGDFPTLFFRRRVG